MDAKDLKTPGSANQPAQSKPSTAPQAEPQLPSAPLQPGLLLLLGKPGKKAGMGTSSRAGHQASGKSLALPRGGGRGGGKGAETHLLGKAGQQVATAMETEDGWRQGCENRHSKPSGVLGWSGQTTFPKGGRRPQAQRPPSAGPPRVVKHPSQGPSAK